MNKLQQIINNKWFPYTFFCIAIGISVFQHYRIFSLDIIGVHVWRQTQTQTVIQNFAFEDFNILNPRLNDYGTHDRIYRMEFPLTQWIIAGLYKFFGNHLIITRLFFFITTLISMVGIYKLIFELTGKKKTSMLSAWFFLFSPIIYYYSVNPMPDNLALCFSIWALFYWIKYLNFNVNIYFILSCVFFVLGFAIKLPFIVFGGMYLSKLINLTSLRDIKLKFFLIPFVISFPALVWYISVIGTWHGNGVVKGIIGNQTSFLKLLDILQFNLISTLPELLINYATVPIFIIGFYFVLKKVDYKNKVHFSLLSIGILCIFYFLFEINMIDKIHDYYLFPFMPILFIVIAFGLIEIQKMPFTKVKYLIIISFIISPITAYLRCNTRWNIYEPGFSNEYLFNKKKLREIILEDEKVIVYGDESKSIVLYVINRKGWCYPKNNISEKDFISDIKQGALYLITDCNIDTNKIIQTHILKTVYKKGNLQLYKLK